MTSSKQERHHSSKSNHTNKNRVSSVSKNYGNSQTKCSPKGLLLLSLASFCGILHRYHVSTLFENSRHFSHLSTLEREMSFRSEMGLYYSYYKTIIEATTFAKGIDEIVFNNLTEYPSTINTLERFNLLPEVVLGGMYRVFSHVCDYFKITASSCWSVDRGRGMPPVQSCEGIQQPEYFYLEAVWACAALTGSLLFLYGTLLSDSMIGGLVTVICFFYNHAEATRVQWAPPLRESFAYPFCLLHMYCITWCIKRNRFCNDSTTTSIFHRFQVAAIVTTTTLCLLLWQFSQFLLATQLLCLLLMFSVGILSKFSFFIILLGMLFGVVEAIFLLFGNQMLISSLLSCLLMSSVYSLKIVYPFASRKFTPLKCSMISTGFILVLTFLIKKFILTTKDDGHIINLLWAKLSNYKDFHTLLYTCSLEFDFLGWEPVFKLVFTWLLQCAFVSVAAVVFWICVNRKNGDVDTHIIYNIIQLGAFSVMAVLVMRLKLFFTPHLCIISSLVLSPKFFKIFRPKEIHYSLLVLLIGIMSVAGISNLMEQHNILGEYNNYELEELLTWIENSTPKTSVFAGPMPITAAILLSTRRPVVNHPHYEHASLRERTKTVYSIYSRKPPEEIFHLLLSLKTEYVVISENWCFSHLRSQGCYYTDLWDIEDKKNLNRTPTCPELFISAPLPFKKVFTNSQYVVLRLQPQFININDFNKYR